MAGPRSLKWLSAVSVWLFLAMTLALSASKLALLWLLRLYKYEQIHPATWYLIICMLLMFPHIGNLVYIIWNTPFISSAKDEQLPKTSHVYLGMVGGLMETVAATLFAVEICLVLPEPVFLFLPAAVYTVPLIVKVASALKGHSKQAALSPEGEDTCQGVRQCLTVLLCSYSVWAPAAVAALLYVFSPFNVQLRQAVGLPLLLLVLSAAWTPHVQLMSISALRTRRRNWKAALGYTLLRLVTVPLTLVGIMVFHIQAFRENAAGFLLSGLTDAADYRVWLPLVVSVVCGVVALLVIDVSAKVSLTTPGIWLPALLSPIITFGAAILLWGDVSSKAIWELSGSDVITWLASALAILTWAVPFILPRIKLIEHPTALMRPFSENFFNFCWNPMFFEQSLILNFNAEGIRGNDKEPTEASKKHKHKKVFICTTMFRETEKEMKRYLKSLKLTFGSHRLNNVYLEAHVLMDNAIVENALNEYACQLLSLVQSALGISKTDVHMFKTPYGCQVQTAFEGKFPIFIHMKDSTLFKAKKRWSQVMYMNFILKHRCHLPGQTPECQQGEVFVCTLDKLENEVNRKFQRPADHVTNTRGVPGMTSQTTQLLRCGKSALMTTHGHSSEDTSDDTASESSTTEHSEAYTVSRESSENYNPSEATDSDDSELFSFRCVHNKQLREKMGRNSRAQENFLMRNILRTELAKSVNNNRSLDFVRNTVFLPNDFADRKPQPLPVTFDMEPANPDNLDLDNVYVLATDADTQFKAKSVQALLELCDRDRSLGAACGRTVPVGASKPVVWYQKFEYAKDFWLVKASQNIIGSVTCCPGCFSLYRARALADVLPTFSQPSNTAFDALVKDHGEDRWLCTLMMTQGWKLEYIDHSRNSTHCPDTFTEFFRQRRRWVLSELSNMALIFRSLRSLVRSNTTFSAIFILSLLQMFLWVLLSPTTMLVLVCAGLHVFFGVPLIWSAPVALVCFLGFCIACCLGGRRTQNFFTTAILIAMAILTLVVAAGFVIYFVENIQADLAVGRVQFRPYLLVPILVGGTVYAALLHPGEWLHLVYGLLYAILFPSMFIILPVYAIANMVDQSWGTRDQKRPEFCCVRGSVQDEESPKEEEVKSEEKLNLEGLETLHGPGAEEEVAFWEGLRMSVLGKEVNCGQSEQWLRRCLIALRNRCMVAMVILNVTWFSVLASIFLFVNSDVICYVAAALFSFSLLVQLVGMTSYKVENVLRRYVLRRLGQHHEIWVKHRH